MSYAFQPKRFKLMLCCGHVQSMKRERNETNCSTRICKQLGRVASDMMKLPPISNWWNRSSFFICFSRYCKSQTKVEGYPAHLRSRILYLTEKRRSNVITRNTNYSTMDRHRCISARVGDGVYQRGIRAVTLPICWHWLDALALHPCADYFK